MEWTKDKPTAPGWYWLRGIRETPTIAEVCQGPFDDEPCVSLTGIESITAVRDMPDCEWCGPIPQPPELSGCVFNLETALTYTRRAIRSAAGIPTVIADLSTVLDNLEEVGAKIKRQNRRDSG